MRVLFLEIDTESSWAVASLGPAFLAAYLRQSGHEATFLRVPLAMSLETLVDEVRSLDPGLIGLSLTTRQWLRGREVAGALRRAMHVPLVAGGLHPTFSPESVLATEGFDVVCLGEGEQAIVELVEALAQGVAPGAIAIDNLWGRGGPRPSLRPPFEPIDALPFMARDLLDERHGVVHMATQRGCPFKCTYCAARMYDEMYVGTGAYGRRRSHASVLEELFAIRAAGALNYVIFLDDTFTIHHPWVRQFCSVYGEQLRVPFSLHARVETVNERMLAELAAAGCRHITYGVESGSERLRREVMRRPVANRRFSEVFRWTREAGILVTANYMMGLPGETPAELRATLDLHHEIEPDDFGFFVFYPYPGTHLFRLCVAEGYLPADYLDRPANHRESILDLPTLTRDDIAACYDEWTRVRVVAALRRGDPALAAPLRAQAVADLAHCAATG
jgi:radical SAM superfamily enzyme YgiQ (UPF0313 family)